MISAFIFDVIVNWNSAHCADELGIVAAFSESIDGNHCGDAFFRVPEKYAVAVRRYIDSLQSGSIVIAEP